MDIYSCKESPHLRLISFSNGRRWQSFPNKLSMAETFQVSNSTTRFEKSIVEKYCGHKASQEQDTSLLNSHKIATYEVSIM